MDCVVGLKLSADDDLLKPFEPRDPCSRRHQLQCSVPEIHFRHVLNPGALELEVEGHFGGAIGPLVRGHPELDQAQSRAQPREAQAVAQFGHAGLEQ